MIVRRVREHKHSDGSVCCFKRLLHDDGSICCFQRLLEFVPTIRYSRYVFKAHTLKSKYKNAGAFIDLMQSQEHVSKRNFWEAACDAYIGLFQSKKFFKLFQCLNKDLPPISAQDSAFLKGFWFSSFAVLSKKNTQKIRPCRSTWHLDGHSYTGCLYETIEFDIHAGLVGLPSYMRHMGSWDIRALTQHPAFCRGIIEGVMNHVDTRIKVFDHDVHVGCNDSFAAYESTRSVGDLLLSNWRAAEFQRRWSEMMDWKRVLLPSGVPTRDCKCCGAAKTKDDYSKKQWKRHGVCIVCILLRPTPTEEPPPLPVTPVPTPTEEPPPLPVTPVPTPTEEPPPLPVTPVPTPTEEPPPLPVSAGRGECTICFDAPALCAFLPCGHQSTCERCSEIVIETTCRCPICRVNITDFLRIFKVY